MDEVQKNTPVWSKLSFFDWLGWFGLLLPFVSAGVVLVIFAVISFRPATHTQVQFEAASLVYEFLILVASFLLSIVSMVGFQWHKSKITIWIASLGLLASTGLGLLDSVAIVFMVFSSTGSNC